MPELPEVETIVRGLAPGLAGRTITEVRVLDRAPLRQPRKRFLDRVAGAEILDATRRAKLAMVHLSGDVTLAFHLKMTGRLLLAPQDAVRHAHDRLEFALSDGRRLVFRDMRKFGYAQALTPAELADWSFWKNLGPEPFEASPESLLNRFSRSRAPVKALLLNQSVIAGIGNIYADESLHRAGILPSRPANTLGLDETAALLHSLREVLNEAIAANGSSIRDYTDSQGRAGSFQNTFRVYGRKGEPCACCSRPLTSAKVAGRTTTFCRSCQS